MVVKKLEKRNKMEKIYLEIREAEGGLDSKLLVEEMLIIYEKVFVKNNFRGKVITWKSGFIQLEINGYNVKKFFLNEIGGHRWQRIPPTEKGSRVHTSTITVALVESLSNSEIKINFQDVDRKYTRGSGNGGQNKNKVHSCVVLTHKSTGISVRIDGRDQKRNEEEAWKILKKRLQEKSDNNFYNSNKNLRRQQIGHGLRCEKRRTYRVKDNLVIDHISNKKISLTEIYNGNIKFLHK